MALNYADANTAKAPMHSSNGDSVGGAEVYVSTA